jgi:hypothetical protein
VDHGVGIIPTPCLLCGPGKVGSVDHSVGIILTLFLLGRPEQVLPRVLFHVVSDTLENWKLVLPVSVGHIRTDTYPGTLI